MKIQATEVRVNNFVNARKTPFTLNAIDIQAIVNEGAIYYAIKLTKEHLRIFGFIADESGDNFAIPLPTGDGCELSVEFEMGTTCIVRNYDAKEIAKSTKFNKYDFCYIKHPNYVHELQNLYFALCGKELEPQVHLSELTAIEA